jgi:hypothetical protein
MIISYTVENWISQEPKTLDVDRNEAIELQCAKDFASTNGYLWPLTFNIFVDGDLLKSTTVVL